MAIRSKNHFATQLGQKIREIRINRNMSISDLAYESRLDYTQLSRIELGKINTSVFTMYQVSRALDIPMEMLFKDIK